MECTTCGCEKVTKTVVVPPAWGGGLILFCGDCWDGDSPVGVVETTVTEGVGRLWPDCSYGDEVALHGEEI